MIENLLILMSFFKLIKLLVRHGLPSKAFGKSCWHRLNVCVSQTPFPACLSTLREKLWQSSPPATFFVLINGYNKNETVKTRYTDYFRVHWQHSRLILALWTLCMSDPVWSPVGVNGGTQAAWNFIRATLWQTNNLQSRHHTLLLQRFIEFHNQILLWHIQMC